MVLALVGMAIGWRTLDLGRQFMGSRFMNAGNNMIELGGSQMLMGRGNIFNSYLAYSNWILLTNTKIKMSNYADLCQF